MRESSERVESPGAYVAEFVSLCHVFFRTALLCSDGYHLKRGWMSLYDVVGINCEKGATTENQGAGVKCQAKGCMFDDCVCHQT